MNQAVIFGCGGTAVTNRDMIHKHFHVMAYTDNNSKLWGKEFDGVSIIPPSQIPADADIVVASGLYYQEIIDGLLETGQYTAQQIFIIVNEKLIQYFPEGRHGEELEFQYFPCEVSLTTLELGISGICNSKCKYCKFYSEYSDYEFYRGLMTDEIIEEICRQLPSIDTLKNFNFVGSGETLIHPKWADYAARIIKVCPTVEKYVIYTNGMLLTKENVDSLKRLPFPKLQLVLSIDGLSPEDCEYWRKGEKFSVIRENLHRAYDVLGQDVDFVLSGLVVLPESIDTNDVDAIKSFIKTSDHWRREEFPFMTCTNHLVHPLVENIPGTRVIEASVPLSPCRCKNPFNFSTIWANGDIISCPCGFIFEDSQMLRIGNIKTDRLLDVFYHGEVLQHMRRELNSGRKPKACGTCAELGGRTIRCLQRT